MPVNDIVLARELGSEFSIGGNEANKITIKFDGTTISKDASGLVSATGTADVVVNGNVVGDTLILNKSGGGTVNIPLIGNGSLIDFSALNAVQSSALSDRIKGELMCGAFGSQLGYLLPL